MYFYKKKGFTLLELLIVVIIIGILASLAIPRFITAMQKARKGAAASMLGVIRSGQMRYYAEYNAYTSTIGNLDTSMTGSPDWTLTAGLGSAASLGQTTHTNGEVYTISEGGVISGP